MIVVENYYVIATKCRPTNFIGENDKLVDFFLNAKRYSNKEYADQHQKCLDFPDNYEAIPVHAEIEL